MSNRCLGIILGHVTGHNSAHVQEVTGYPPPWTLLDAQVYLGMCGIGIGIGLEDYVTNEADNQSIGMIDLGRFPLGCLAILSPENGKTVVIKRDEYAIGTPLLHCLLYREGKWYDPQEGEILSEVSKPENIYQIWPMYQVAPIKEDEGNGSYSRAS